MSRLVPVPPTTDLTIIFPLDAFARSYDSSFYSPVLTGGRASHEEINQILAEVQTIRKPYAKKVGLFLCCFFFYLIACIFGLLLWDFNVDLSDGANVAIGIVVFVAAVIVGMIVFIKTIKNMTIESRNKVQDLFARVNANFTGRGLRWNAPVHFPRWVELWKDFNAQNTNQPGYVPPQVQPYGTYGIPNQGVGAQPQYQQNYYGGYQQNTATGFSTYPQV